MFLEQLATNWRITNPGGNSTAAAFVEPQITQTRPDALAKSTGVQANGDGLFICGYGGQHAAFRVKLKPFGTTTAAQTFLMNVYGWSPTSSDPGRAGNPPPTAVWIPDLLATYTCTLGTQTGIGTTDLTSSQLMCTTITSTYSPSTEADFNIIFSPGTNRNALIIIETFGYMFFEVRFNMNASAVSANCLYAFA